MGIGSGLAGTSDDGADIGIDDPGGEAGLAGFHAAEIDTGGHPGHGLARDHNLGLEGGADGSSGFWIAINGGDDRIPLTVLSHDRGIDHLKTLFKEFVHQGGFRDRDINLKVVIAILGCADILLVDDEHHPGIAHALNEVLDRLHIPGHAGLIHRGEHLHFVDVIAALALVQDPVGAHIAPRPGEDAVLHHLVILDAGLGIDDCAQDVFHGLALGVVEGAIPCSRDVIVGDGPKSDRLDLCGAGCRLWKCRTPAEEAGTDNKKDFSVQGVLLTAVGERRSRAAAL